MDEWAGLLLVSLGFIAGVLSLPWADRMAPRSPIGWYLAAWTCFGPLLVLVIILLGLRAYVRAWAEFNKRSRVKQQYRRDEL